MRKIMICQALQSEIEGQERTNVMLPQNKLASSSVPLYIKYFSLTTVFFVKLNANATQDPTQEINE